MPTDFKMDYNAVEEMANAFRKAGSQLSDIASGMQGAVTTINNGALQGTHGDRFASAVQDKLLSALYMGISKFEELAGELETAIAEMQSEDTTASGRFSNNG